MTDTTASNRPTAQSLPQSAKRTMFRWAAMVALLLTSGFTVGYTLGWHWQDSLLQQVLSARNTAQTDNKRLSNTNGSLAAQIKALTDQLDAAQRRLAEFSQPSRQLKLNSNHAEPVSIGVFNVGLGNALGSSSININVNGNQKDMVPGSAINLTFNCRVELSTFDVLNSSVIIHTSCSAANP